MYFTSDDGFQNIFVYQPTFNTIKYKKANTEYIISWISKGVYNSWLDALNCDFLPNIKYFNKKIGIQFKDIPFVIEQNNYTLNIVHACIVYDLDN